MIPGSPLGVGPMCYMLCLVLYLDYIIINPMLQLSKLRLADVTSLPESTAEPAAYPALPDSVHAPI